MFSGGWVSHGGVRKELSGIESLDKRKKNAFSREICYSLGCSGRVWILI